MKRNTAVTFLALSFLIGSAAAQAAVELTVTPGAGQVSFEAIGSPSSLRIRGTTTALDGKLQSSAEGVTGKLAVELGTLDTGIKMRNEHMTKRYLETDKFPKGELTIKRVGNLKEGSVLAAGTVPFEGDFTLHGVTKPVQGDVALSSLNGGSVPFEASFAISLKDYGIHTPSFAGITVADRVKVNVKGAAQLPAGKATL